MSAKIMFESYEAPQVEVVEVEVEKGFAASKGGIEQLDEEIW